MIGFQAAKESLETKPESDDVDAVEERLQKAAEELDLDLAELPHPRWLLIARRAEYGCKRLKDNRAAPNLINPGLLRNESATKSAPCPSAIR
jgi:hypothetical protein